jgi:hypothetical protein
MAQGELLAAWSKSMSNTPRQPKTSPTSKSGMKPGEGASAPQGEETNAGGERSIEEEDVFGGVERTHGRRVTSTKTKP